MEKSVKERGGIMQCTYLKEGFASCCKAWDSVYFPSHFEVITYCKTEDHTRCPFYIKSMRESSPIFE